MKGKYGTTIKPKYPFKLPEVLDCFLYISVLECTDIEGPLQYSSQSMN